MHIYIMYIYIHIDIYMEKEAGQCNIPLEAGSKIFFIDNCPTTFLKIQYSKKSLLIPLLMFKLSKNIYHADQHYSHVHQDSLQNTDFV